jgi:transcriptional regulator with XRE-family HTH domain
MTATRTGLTVSDAIGAAVRTARTRQGWNREALAAVCAELGLPRLTASVIYDIESGRRTRPRGRREITAEEWLTLSAALNVAPVHLAVPLDDETEVQLTPAVSAQAGLARRWLRGYQPLPGTDRRIFYAFVPEAELDIYERRLQREQMIAVGEIAEEGSEGS